MDSKENLGTRIRLRGLSGTGGDMNTVINPDQLHPQRKVKVEADYLYKELKFCFELF